MARTLTPVANTNQFQVWFDRTNDILAALASEIVTANAAGATTTGNGFVVGYLGANTLVATNLRGGDLSTPATLTVTSNVQFNSGISVYNSTHLNVNAATSGTGSQVVDYFTLATYRSGEYIITIKSTSSNAYQTSKLLILHDDGNAYLTEYGIVTSNTSAGVIGTFAATSNTTHVILSVTPTVTTATVKGTKILTIV